MAYLLDANVFIQAKNRHYGFDFCPAFWDWLSIENRAGRLISLEKVGQELIAGNDGLSTWAEGKGAEFFLPADPAMLPALAKVSSWVGTQHYEPAAIYTFLQVADYYLISHALAHGHTVVTHEIPAPTPRKVKIPNVCIGLGIPCVTPFEMLRNSRARFVL